MMGGCFGIGRGNLAEIRRNTQSIRRNTQKCPSKNPSISLRAMRFLKEKLKKIEMKTDLKGR
jgi:hypothetical protein